MSPEPGSPSKPAVDRVDPPSGRVLLADDLEPVMRLGSIFSAGPAFAVG